MQIDDILLLRMNRQYLFAPAKDELTVLRDLCGLQSQFYGNCLHALRLRCGKAPDEDILDDVGISWEMDRSWEWGRRADACGSPCPPSCVPAVWGRPGWARRI